MDGKILGLRRKDEDTLKNDKLVSDLYEVVVVKVLDVASTVFECTIFNTAIFNFGIKGSVGKGNKGYSI